MYKIIGANQVEYGPVSADQIRAWIAEGRVNTQTLAQAEGETTWKPLSSFPEFATSIPSTPPPAPAPLGAPLLEAEGRNRALASVSGPSIALIIICGLGIALGLLNFLLRMLGMGMVGMNGMNTFEGQNEEVARMMTIYTGVAGMIIQGF